jgi:mycobactin lysine-N-oxygenase
LGHAIEMSGAEVYYGKVEEISLADGSWTVSQLETQSETAYEYDEFDGIVFTGAGPASRKFPRVRDPRVFTGVDFWRRLVGVRKNMPSSPDKPIVIIGGGGTAAAITAWFIRNGYGDKPIQLINNQAMLFTRTTNFFENRLFDDDDTWAALPDKERKSFTQRLNRGVVWETVTGLLSEARQLSLLPGFAKEVRYSGHRPGAHRADLEVCYENALGETSIDAGLVVDATGFDSWAFDRLLPAPVRTRIDLVGRENLTNQLRDDLSLPLDDLPKLHVPNLSETCGPGFGSLMVLGAMADRILSAYLDP